MLALGNENALLGAWVDAGVVHTGRKCAGCRVKVLHLLGFYVCALQMLGKFDCIVQGTGGMAGHQIRYEILVFV